MRENQNRDWNGAIADFDKAISINPTFVEAYNGRGLARYNQEDLDRRSLITIRLSPSIQTMLKFMVIERYPG